MTEMHLTIGAWVLAIAIAGLVLWDIFRDKDDQW